MKKKWKWSQHKKEAFKESIKDMIIDTIGTLSVIGVIMGIMYTMLY